MQTLNFDTTIPTEHSSLNSKFDNLKTASRADEKRVNKNRIDRSKLPTLENVSMSEKRSQNQLPDVPNKRINEKSTDSSSSYLQQAGNYVSSIKNKILLRKND